VLKSKASTIARLWAHDGSSMLAIAAEQRKRQGGPSWRLAAPHHLQQRNGIPFDPEKARLVTSGIRRGHAGRPPAAVRRVAEFNNIGRSG